MIRRNSEDNDLFLAWLPVPVRELVVNRGHGWQFERSRWYGFFVNSGAHRGARAAHARGEMFLFDPELDVPRWITPVPPAPMREQHDRETGQNPGDEGLRRAERAAAASGAEEDRIRLAHERKRRGEEVDDWKLVPAAYVFLEAYKAIEPKFVLTTPTSGALDLGEGRVEAYRGEAFKPWVAGGYPDKPERFYATACSYPLVAWGDTPHYYPEPQGDALLSHLAAVESWRGRGAVVVSVHQGRVQELHDANHSGTGSSPESCKYCERNRIATLRVLVMEVNARNALTTPQAWGDRQQSVLIPRQWDWARLMKRVGKRWKNNPVLPCQDPYCMCAGEGHPCAGCGASAAQQCSCRRCERCRRLVRGRRDGGVALYMSEDDEALCARCE